MPNFLRKLFSLEASSGWQSEDKAFRAGIEWERQRRRDKRRKRRERRDREGDAGVRDEHGPRLSNRDDFNLRGHDNDEHSDGDNGERERQRTRCRRERDGRQHEWENEREYAAHRRRHADDHERSQEARHGGHPNDEGFVSRQSHRQPPSRSEYYDAPDPAESIHSNHANYGDQPQNLPLRESWPNGRARSRDNIYDASPRDPRAQEHLRSPAPSDSISVRGEKHRE